MGYKKGEPPYNPCEFIYSLTFSIVSIQFLFKYSSFKYKAIAWPIKSIVDYSKSNFFNI